METEVKDPLIGKQFEDENSQMHEVTERLSAGGQGVVYRTKDENVLIKLKIEVDPTTNEEVIIEGEKEYKEYVKSILDARIIDIPKGVQITKPVLFLKSPQCGYIMRMLDNMVPIQKLMYTTSIKDPVNHYKNTGGLKRRLELLAKFAKMFALLHSRPLVYADISEGNLFVSSNANDNAAWLIDADNLKHRIHYHNITGTAGYQAPEIAQQQSTNTTYSDVYSFAIVAYKVLTYKTSPFIGALMHAPAATTDSTEDESWDDGGWDDEEETQNPHVLAEQGKLPWVDDPLDDSNRQNAGFPIKLVASPLMFDLFNRTFSQEGRQNPASRPTMQEWYQVLNNALNAIMTCNNCEQTFFFTEDTCPFCRAVRGPIYISKIKNMFNLQGMLADDEQVGEFVQDLPSEQAVSEVQVGWKVIELNRGVQILTKHQLFESFFTEENEDCIELELSSTIILRNVCSNAFLVKHGEQRQLLHPYTSIEISNTNYFELVSYIHEFKSRKLEFRRRD